jgi:hypothetical protein
MANFTLREPPEGTGNYQHDYNELLLWCRELYENLWLVDFTAMQQRKNQKKGTENEE